MPLINSRRVAFKAFIGSANGSDVIVSVVILAGRMVLNIPSALQSWLPGPIFDEINYSMVRLHRCTVSLSRTFSTLSDGALSPSKDRDYTHSNLDARSFLSRRPFSLSRHLSEKL